MQKYQNLNQIKKVTWIGIAGNFGLSIVKFIVGYLGKSQAVIADAVHSISDISTDFAIIIGVKYWSAPPDENHPYGHLRIEAIITIIIGIILAVVAINLGYKSLMTIRQPYIEQTKWIAIIGPVLSIILKELLYRWTIYVGTNEKSNALIANAWHHRSDALSSLPALIVVTVSSINPDWAFVDGIGALIISLFILKVSWDIIKPSLAELADHGASAKEREMIKKITLNVNGVKDAHAIRSRKFGSKLHVDLHILVNPELTVRKGHDISEEVKRILIEKGPEIIDVVVHLEPYEKEQLI